VITDGFILNRPAYKVNISINELFNCGETFNTSIKEKNSEFLESGDPKGKILGDDEAPTLKMLKEFGYGAWVSAFRKNGIKYNDILREAGFKLNREIDKREKMTLEGAAEDLKNKIMPDLREKNSELVELGDPKGKILGDDEAPTLKMLKEFGYGLWVSAFRKNGIKYNDVIREAELIPYDYRTAAKIGSNLHIILESIFLDHTRSLNCNSYSEIRHANLINKNRPDNTIIRDDIFIKNIEKEYKSNKIRIPDNIKLINVDYVFGDNKSNIQNKLFRGYQSKEKFLIIVSTNEKIKFKIPPEIPYRKNVRVVSYVEFGDFIGYEPDVLKEFERVIDLAKLAFNRKRARDELFTISLKKSEIIKKKFSNMQDSFEDQLRKIGLDYLLGQKTPALRKIDSYI